ncbi:hypothetical protein M900_0707 [Bacteriovorax sp. Seq25_V]|nr:hypothetical protein M900_0707 [Bacteriovorax sp. Seq25_V]
MKVKKLFVISKQEMLRRTIEGYCKKQGIEIFHIDDADESIHFIADLTPDVILLCSESYSEEQVQAIKNTQIPVVHLISADAKTEEKHLVLPINPVSLISEIEALF